MYTVCPRCALPLAVTVADLRAGQGYVRCGRCANVFNALLALSEESGPASAARTPGSPSFIDMDTASATVSRPALQDIEITAEHPELPPESIAALEAGEPADSRPTERAAAVAQPQPTPQPEPQSQPQPQPQLQAQAQPSPAPEVAPPATPATPASSAPPAPPASPASAPAWSPPALRLVDSPPRPPPPDFAAGQRDAAGDTSQPAAAQPVIDLDDTGEFRGTSTFETIVLEGDTFLQTEETIPEEVMASELADVSRRIAQANDGGRERRRFDAGSAGAEEFAEPGTDDADVIELRDYGGIGASPGEAGEVVEIEGDIVELAALREATGEFKHEANLGVPPGEAAQALRPPSLRPGWRHVTLATLLALVLVGQAVNHWRDDLATHAGWYRTVKSLSDLLGEPLRPNWDLNAYDVRQLGATPEGPDNHALRVRLRLANVGLRTQALPLLRLTLLDRYGKPVSQGELQPAQYLPRELHGLQFIAHDQRIDTEVRVQDPTQQASSFELDVCVAASGGLRCAGDSPTIAGHS